MPQIRTYDSQAPLGTITGGRRASAADAGGQTAQALGATGRALGSVQKAIDDKKERDATFWRESTVAKARGEWTQRMVAAQQQAPAGAPDFTQNFLDTFDQYQQELAQSAPTEASRRALQVDMENLRSTFASKAVVFEATQGAQHRATLAGQTLDDNLNSVRADPTLLPDALAQNKRMIDGLQIPAADKEAMHLRAAEGTSLAAIDGRLDGAETVEEAQAIADELRKSGKWKESLSTQGYAQALARADTKVQQIQAHERQVVIDGLADAVPEMEAGIRTGQASSWLEQINAVIDDPREKERLTKRVERAAAIGDNSNFVRGATPEQILARRFELEAQRQTPGDFRLDAHSLQAFDAAVALREKAINEDAALYAIQQSDDVARAYQALNEDPSPENRERYISLMKAEQARLKGSDEDIDVLPKAYVSSIAARMRAVAITPEGAKDAYATLVSEADSWGTQWPVVYRQLAKEKALSGPQLVAARMTRVDQRIGAENLLTAAAIGDKDLKRNFDDPAVLTDLKTDVHEHLAELQGTLVYQTGGQDWYNRFKESTNTLAMYYMSQGMAGDEAAQRAAGEIVNKDYTFRDTYRVPNRVQDPQAVNDGATRLRSDLATMEMDVAAPPSLMGLDQDLVRERVIDRLRSEGRWLTNANETGLVLVYPGDSSPVMVRDGDRVKPLEFTWDELRDAGHEDRVRALDAPKVPSGNY